MFSRNKMKKKWTKYNKNVKSTFSENFTRVLTTTPCCFFIPKSVSTIDSEMYRFSTLLKKLWIWNLKINYFFLPAQTVFLIIIKRMLFDIFIYCQLINSLIDRWIERPWTSNKDKMSMRASYEVLISCLWPGGARKLMSNSSAVYVMGVFFTACNM